MSRCQAGRCVPRGDPDAPPSSGRPAGRPRPTKPPPWRREPADDDGPDDDEPDLAVPDREVTDLAVPLADPPAGRAPLGRPSERASRTRAVAPPRLPPEGPDRRDCHAPLPPAPPAPPAPPVRDEPRGGAPARPVLLRAGPERAVPGEPPRGTSGPDPRVAPRVAPRLALRLPPARAAEPRSGRVRSSSSRPRPGGRGDERRGGSSGIGHSSLGRKLPNMTGFASAENDERPHEGAFER